MSAVLLAAKCPIARARLGALVSGRGFAVGESEPGESLARAVELRPLLTVLEGLDHREEARCLIAELRGHTSLAGMPILVLTAPGDSEGAAFLLEAGADDWLPDDIGDRLLLARIACLVERRQLQLHAALTEQLSQLGKLVAGIVHEIRGPLSVIGGNAEVMLMSLPPDSPSLLWAEPILRTARLLQKRLEHLMAAVRAGPPVFSAVDLVELVQEASHLFVRGTDPRRSKIAIEPNFPTDLPPARADAGRILQVLLNLLANAHEAVSEAGQPTAIHLSAQVEHTESGRWLSVDVRDNGPGVPEAIVSRLFEPYFTTKPAGSGYGLYLASEIMREHGGTLAVRNAPEGGACFVLRLPVAESPLDGSTTVPTA